MIVSLQKYKHYSVDEFVDDQYFWLWVLQEDEDAIEFWESFLQEYPNKHRDVELAKKRVLEINGHRFVIEQEKVLSIWTKISASINN